MRIGHGKEIAETEGCAKVSRRNLQQHPQPFPSNRFSSIRTLVESCRSKVANQIIRCGHRFTRTIVFSMCDAVKERFLTAAASRLICERPFTSCSRRIDISAVIDESNDRGDRRPPDRSNASNKPDVPFATCHLRSSLANNSDVVGAGAWGDVHGPPARPLTCPALSTLDNGCTCPLTGSGAP